MATRLPTPIEFDLPEGWRPAPPDAVDAAGAAFLAFLPETDEGFTANVTIDGEFRPDPASLTDLADGSVESLRAAVGEVSVLDRVQVGPADSPALTQTLRVAADVGGRPRDLVQGQVYLRMVDVDHPTDRAVIRLVLTTTANQYLAVLPQFQSFVSSVRAPTAGPPEGTAPDQ